MFTFWIVDLPDFIKDCSLLGTKQCKMYTLTLGLGAQASWPPGSTTVVSDMSRVDYTLIFLFMEHISVFTTLHDYYLSSDSLSLKTHAYMSWLE